MYDLSAKATMDRALHDRAVGYDCGRLGMASSRSRTAPQTAKEQERYNDRMEQTRRARQAAENRHSFRKINGE